MPSQILLYVYLFHFIGQVGALQACFLAKRNYKVDVFEMRQGIVEILNHMLWTDQRDQDSYLCLLILKLCDL